MRMHVQKMMIYDIKKSLFFYYKLVGLLTDTNRVVNWVIEGPNIYNTNNPLSLT